MSQRWGVALAVLLLIVAAAMVVAVLARGPRGAHARRPRRPRALMVSGLVVLAGAAFAGAWAATITSGRSSATGTGPTLGRQEASAATDQLETSTVAASPPPTTRTPAPTTTAPSPTTNAPPPTPRRTTAKAVHAAPRTTPRRPTPSKSGTPRPSAKPSCTTRSDHADTKHQHDHGGSDDESDDPSRIGEP